MLHDVTETDVTREELAREERMVMCAESHHWQELLEIAAALEGQVEEAAVGRCLERALMAPAEIFDRLLELLPGREYVGTTVVTGIEHGRVVRLSGTLVTLAAAQGKAGHLQCLLRRGWDVNSASPDAAWRLKHLNKTPVPYYNAALDWFEPCSARPESRMELLFAADEGGWGHPVQEVFAGVTPLAAAVFCGRETCVRILLEHGAWKEESPSVTRVLIRDDRRKDREYQTCRRAVLSYGDVPRPLALWTVVRYMREEQLEAELRRCRYDEAAICEAVRQMTNIYRRFPRRGSWEEERTRDLQRLRLLERHYPQVLRRQENVRLLLRWVVLQNCEDAWLDFVLSLCPQELDISLIREGLVRMPARRMRAFLIRLCQGRSCVMDRDSVPPTTPVLVLQTLLKYVKFRPPVSGMSVSGLSYAILSSGNLQLIRKGLSSGAITAAEPTALLLRCMGELPWANMARTLLLTMPRPQTEEAHQRGDICKELLLGPMFRWQPPEVREADYSCLLDGSTSAELETELILRGLYDYRNCVTCEAEDGVWEAGSVLSILCWMGRHEQVERWLRCGSSDQIRRYDRLRPAGSAYTLCATPLCTAAFAGQRQVVETLLRHGARADESCNGYPSTLLWGENEETLPITPLLAAMVRGHWDIVRLLMERGAGCDLEQHAVQRLWNLYNEEDLHHAVQVHLAGESLQQKRAVSLTA